MVGFRFRSGRNAMSDALIDQVHARLREAFGEPYSMLGRDSQWSLRAPLDGDGHTDGAAPTLFVLVNGAVDKPAAWIFDPFDSGENVWRSAITLERHVEETIAEIRRRLAHASHRMGNGHAGKKASAAAVATPPPRGMKSSPGGEVS
jgi:hypothetical protein